MLGSYDKISKLLASVAELTEKVNKNNDIARRNIGDLERNMYTQRISVISPLENNIMYLMKENEKLKAIVAELVDYVYKE